MENYKIIGTSHVSKDSKKQIKETFFEFEPDSIAVELDLNRFQSLKNNKTSGKPSFKLIKEVGLTGFLFAIIAGFLQKRIGRILKVQPGSEFLLSANLAKNNNLRLYLIDRDIRITLKRINKNMGWKEKLKIVKEIIWPFNKKKIKFDVSKVPEDELVKKLTFEMKKEYPGIYKALVDERNQHMAKQVAGIMKKWPEEKILVVIGAGHKEGFEEYLKEYLKS